MQTELHKTKVHLQIIEEPAIIQLIKRDKFIKGKVISVGSRVVAGLQKNDIVTLFNEGVEYHDGAGKTRIVDQQAIVLKYH